MMDGWLVDRWLNGQKEDRGMDVQADGRMLEMMDGWIRNERLENG